jgi:hypothetical protein
MRREIVMLRAELEEMRAIAEEARKTNRALYAYIDDILENQYQWQREAERLSSLLKRVQQSAPVFILLGQAWSPKR